MTCYNKATAFKLRRKVTLEISGHPPAFTSLRRHRAHCPTLQMTTATLRYFPPPDGAVRRLYRLPSRSPSTTLNLTPIPSCALVRQYASASASSPPRQTTAEQAIAHVRRGPEV
ncbi:hypothetical protein GSI_03194 [Ganoderma sinense ZZ0214-1]|uniref:Uncharacterized protein n=1 Tax=Ganoderma sinense ZZ0214-1 TaxID=1077348 RepID=A0A2G8SKY2_9APHY|nr:hypothetical protein GSI_03194 [Ganoderma sinense ZZ0214-1]